MTVYLLHSHGGRHYLRLIPMEISFRYSEQGVWLDGRGVMQT